MLDHHRVDLDDVEQFVLDRRWTDGLPVRPPTGDAVAAFVEEAGLEPSTEVGAVPPSYGIATVENIAVNAYMAGCRPGHLPLIVAATQAMLEPRFNLYAIQCTTNPVTPMTVVNGPARHTLGLSSGRGVLGPGPHANGVVGRAIRFVMGNIGGSFDERIDMAVHGSPLKYSCCLAEAEEESPWEPLHVWLGHDATADVVTTIPVEGLVNVVVSYGNTQPEHLIDYIGRAMRTVGTCYYFTQGNPVLVVNPLHASILAGGGYDRAALQEALFEEARIPVDSMPYGNIPVGDWTVVDGAALGVRRPEDIYIVVAGAEGGHHTLYGMGFGLSEAASARIS